MKKIVVINDKIPKIISNNFQWGLCKNWNDGRVPTCISTKTKYNVYIIPVKSLRVAILSYRLALSAVSMKSSPEQQVNTTHLALKKYFCFPLEERIHWMRDDEWPIHYIRMRGPLTANSRCWGDTGKCCLYRSSPVKVKMTQTRDFL